MRGEGDFSFYFGPSVPKREFITFSWHSSSAAKGSLESEIQNLFQGLTFQFMCLLLSEPPERTIAFGHVSDPFLLCFCCGVFL